MSRRRWVYRQEKNGQVVAVEVGEDFQGSAGLSAPVTDLYMDGMRATDGTDIGSRAKRREYIRAHGLADADDFKGVWERAERARAQPTPLKAIVPDVLSALQECRRRRK